VRFVLHPSSMLQHWVLQKRRRVSVADTLISFVGDRALPPNADRNRAVTTNWEAKADLPCRRRVFYTNHCRTLQAELSSL
jgi:hypothetical protein